MVAAAVTASWRAAGGGYNNAAAAAAARNEGMLRRCEGQGRAGQGGSRWSVCVACAWHSIPCCAAALALGRGSRPDADD